MRSCCLIAIAVGASLLFVGCGGGGATLLGGAIALASLLGLAACAPAGTDGSGCDGEWGYDCRDGRRVRACCPVGVACNFGWGVEWCADDRCVIRPATCDGADADVGDTSDDIEIATPTDALAEADASCDGAWESACRDGRVVQLCCPAGLACNYGQTMVDCGDGTCVDMPATCPR